MECYRVEDCTFFIEAFFKENLLIEFHKDFKTPFFDSLKIFVLLIKRLTSKNCLHSQNITNIRQAIK